MSLPLALSSSRPRLTPILVAVCGWSLAAFVMAMAQMNDAAARGRDVDGLRVFVEILPFFTPLMLLSWGLDAAFRRWPALADGPRPLAGTFAFVIFVFFPAFLLFEVLLQLNESGAPLSDFGTMLRNQRLANWWMDLMIVTGTFALQLAIEAFRRKADRERALLVARSDNLKLRLHLLQGQLEPHFLFNALNSISALVRSGDRTDALAALSKVSDLLRFALRASKTPWMSIADEIGFIDGYLDVQTLRFGDRLTVNRAVADADWTGIACPPLLLQPLVENAVRHGIEARAGSGSLDLSIGTEGDKVTFLIRNDIGEARTEGHGLGFGITRDRLAALYGDRATIDATAADGRFTVALSIPLEDLSDKTAHPDR